MSKTINQTEVKTLYGINGTNSHKRKYSGLEKENECCETSPYYDETIPKNDPKFLEPIRQWEKRMGFVTAIRWRNAISMILLHAIGFIFLIYVIFTKKVTLKMAILGFIFGQIGGFGVTAGAHRYWTHRSFKAKLPLQIILMFCYSVAGQNTVYEWVRDHRVHHKFSETSADPHDVRRGFFFSHVGWLMMKKHPHVIMEGRKMPLDDITNDPLIQFFTRYFTIFKIINCFIIPTIIPMYLWNEGFMFCFLSNIVRYVFNLNFTWSVNSFAHIWGNKPYDTHILPVENWSVSIVAMGEGWHNYHHTFPWDYKAAELSYFINVTTLVIDAFALFGWAYDRKKATPAIIKSVIKRRGPQMVSH